MVKSLSISLHQPPIILKILLQDFLGVTDSVPLTTVPRGVRVYHCSATKEVNHPDTRGSPPTIMLSENALLRTFYGRIVGI